MTIEDFCRQRLEENGLFPNQADEVLAAAKTESGMDSIKWGDRIEDYPVSVPAVLSIRIDDAAVRWIDANCPMHWARALFLHETPSEDAA